MATFFLIVRSGALITHALITSGNETGTPFYASKRRQFANSRMKKGLSVVCIAKVKRGQPQARNSSQAEEAASCWTTIKTQRRRLGYLVLVGKMVSVKSSELRTPQ